MIEYIPPAKAITTAAIAPAIKMVLSGANLLGVAGVKKWENSKFHSKIQKKISSLETLKTFWSSDKTVNLIDFYHPSKIYIDGARKKCDFLSELPIGNLIIEGIVGQGKSIFLRHLSTSEIRSNQSNGFPIFIELSALSEKNSLEVAIKNYLEDVNIDGFEDETFNYVMSSGNFILLLDAFDELDEKIVKETYLQIERYADRYEKTKIIVTSRPSSEIQKSTKFKILKLASLSEADYTPFLSKLGLPAVFIAEIKTSIRNSPSKIADLITTPLMLTLVVLAYKSVKKIPDNLPDFFEVLFKCVFSGHDNAKPYIKRNIATNLSEKKLQELFEAFCFFCLKGKTTRSLSTTQFDSFFESSRKALAVDNCESVDFRHDMHKVACLILPDGFENWVFLHKSVMEYYAASFVKKSNETFAERFYKYVMKDNSSWLEVLVFLSYIDDYRFNKYYLIPEIDSFFEKMPCLNEAVNFEILVNYFKYLNLDFRFEIDSKETKRPTGFRIWHDTLPFCIRENIFNPFFSYFDSISKSDLHLEDFEYLETLIKNSENLQLDLQQVIRIYGVNNLISELRLMNRKILDRKTAAIEAIDLQQARCDFLDE
ncbi:NACHT domain-containing protein [Comamonas testosteroni]|uniref:NACHT domain-containing protein n=1 Tax=Comamonas testosteroni TaxID=285 RepID=UPI0009BC0CF7|nr:NACHT domain-containing protein [Comamonas testosteroni]